MIRLVFINLLLSYNIATIFGQGPCEFINRIQDYQKNIKLGVRFGKFVIDSSTFDIVKYLKLYDKLKVNSGEVCHIYYQSGILEGEPIIYTISDTVNLLAHAKRIKQRIIKERPLSLINIQDTNGLSESIYYDIIHNPKIRASKHITPENKEIGLFQFLFFNIMGEQFALIGHSNYTQRKILCNKEELKDIIKAYTDNELFKVDKIKLNSIKNLNPIPIIYLSDSTCKISWYELWTHSGLYLKSYEIDRKPPFEIKPIKTKEIFSIELGFDY